MSLAPELYASRTPRKSGDFPSEPIKLIASCIDCILITSLRSKPSACPN